MLLITAWLVIRIINLRCPVVLTVSLLILALAFGGGWLYQQKINSQTCQEPVQVKQSLLVQPDKIKTTDQVVSFIGINQQTKYGEVVTVIIKDPVLLEEIQRIKTATNWQVTGELQPIIPATNENQFDRQRFYRQQRVYQHLQVAKINQIVPVEKTSFINWCHQIRYRLIEYFSIMPQPLAGCCQQLLVGQTTSAIGREMQDAKKLGIIHLFCISGMHVFLLVSIIRLLGIYMWLEREWLDLLLVFILPCYLVIAGDSISITRAVMMAEISLMRRFLGVDALDGWALSLLAGLVIEPELGLSLGGQLSYTLSFILQVLSKKLRNFHQCLILGCLSLPSILSYTFEFHLLSLVLSYPMIPLFSFVLFPLVLISASTFKVIPAISYLVNSLLKYFQLLLSLLASLPGEIHFGKPPLVVAILLFIITLWCVSSYQRRYRWLTLFLVYLLCFICIHYPLNGEVTFVDIGQGDCIIIRQAFNRQVVMIDTGGKLQFGNLTSQHQQNNVASQTSINYLKSCGIHHLDAVYLSHHDVDHIGYLPTILDQLAVDRVVVPAGMEKQPAFIRRVHLSCNTKIVPVTAGVVDPVFKILHPFAPGKANNEDSMVLSGRFGGLDFLFTGDLDQQNELQVIKHYPDLHADVLKLGHHGSKTASNEKFLTQLGVKQGIISAGRFNRYHHPNEEVITLLKAHGIQQLSTQQYGMISYHYTNTHGYWTTKLIGDELKWTLPNCLKD